MQVALRFASPVVIAVALLVGCGGAKSPRATAPEMHTWIPAQAPYAFAMLEPIDLEAMINLYGQFSHYLEDGLRDTIGGELTAKLAAELSGKGNAAGLESLGFATRMHFAVYGDGLSHVMRLEVKDGTTLLKLAERLAQKFGGAVPPPEMRGEWRVWQVKSDEHTLVVSLGAKQLTAAYGPTQDIHRVMPSLVGTKPPRSLAHTGELFALRDTHHKDAQAIGYADTARMLGIYAYEGKQPDCAGAIGAFAKRVPRGVVGSAIFPDRHEFSMAVDFAPDVLEELRGLRISLPPLVAASPSVAPAQRPLFSMALGADIAKGRELVSHGMSAIRRVAQACHAQNHIDGANEMIDILKEPIPPPFDGIRGAVVVANKFVFPKGVMLPTEIDGFALLTGTDLAGLFRTAKELAGNFLKLDFALDGKLHPVPLSLPIALPYEIAVGGTSTVIAVALGKTGRTDAQKALSATLAPSPFFFFEGDYAALVQLNLDHGNDDDDDDDDDDDKLEEDGSGLGSVATGDADANDIEADKLRSRIAMELYTRALTTLDVDARSVRMFMRYDRRQP